LFFEKKEANNFCTLVLTHAATRAASSKSKSLFASFSSEKEDAFFNAPSLPPRAT
jgi:hypothetical protein